MVHVEGCYCTCCPEGKKKLLYVADLIAQNLVRTKKAVAKEDWDYMAIVGGIPGVGKSTFAQGIAKFLDPNFEQDQICFTAKEFIHRTENGKKGQAFVLDESFADMNSSLYKDPEFVALLNHIQAVRQKNLYLLIVLPDFFTLIKNVAVFRASHLFVPYTKDYSRGDVAVFDRETKRQLYFKGKKECDYKAIHPNFYTDFQMHWFCDKVEYDKRKLNHLLEQKKVKDKGTKMGHQRNVMTYLLHKLVGTTETDIAKMVDLPISTISDWISKGKERHEGFKLAVSETKLKNIMSEKDDNDEETAEEGELSG